MWCIPTVGAEFVACMEDVLDLYAEAYDPDRPVICFDETSKQLIQETRQPLPARPGQAERYDYEYRRHGTRNLFMFLEPLAGKRHVAVTQRRTNRDFARCMKWLVDEGYPEAECIRVVLDNLSTHTIAALYETFNAGEANRIRKRLEFHFTPKHASWLNMAETEFSVFGRQAWKGYVPDEQTLEQNVRALEAQRNRQRAKVHWRFTCEDARQKLHRLYPSISE